MILAGAHRPELLRAETLPDVFEASARAHPEHPALIAGRRTLSYGALDSAAGRIAHRLLASGLAAPGRIIGLWLPRGADLLAAQLGIAKAGCAWLPFADDAPAARVTECLQDAGAVALITDAALAAVLPAGTALAPLLVDGLLADLPPGTLPLRRQGLAGEHPAYVIYTSGSTGRPKGIVVPQRAICHFLRAENALLGVTRDDRVYQGFSVSFDMSFEEIWISWLAGATLWLAPRAVTTDPDALLAALTAQRISVLHAVPSLVALLPTLPAGLRLLNLGGEACPQALADRLAVPGRRVVNTYGPTEATVSATLAELRSGAPVTIGGPLPNYGLAIVDEALQPVAAGAPGELCIFGPGLASGYLGRPELTVERYPQGPFAALPGVERLYRTGDLVQLDGDGALRFLGRSDDQVKVRGFRVEPGEIEEALAAQPGVAAAAVVMRPEAAGEGLVAFLVEGGTAQSAPVDAAEREGALRRQLAAVLPAYMVPSRFVTVAALPRLPSGKVDRKALRSQALPALPAVAGGDQPRTLAEAALFAALGPLFPGRALRRADDFFSDLGGHSLATARLVSALRAQHGFAQAAVRDVYEHRRLDAIAAALEAARRVGPDRPAPAPGPSASARAHACRRQRWACGAAQALVLPVPVCLHLATWLAPFFTYHYMTGEDNDSVLLAALLATLVFLGSQAVAFLVVVAAKWLVLGRLRAGRHPLWGLTYFRWWFSEVMAQAAPVYLLYGTPLYRIYLRLLGARIGRDVYIAGVAVAAPDLLEIGDDAALGTAVGIANARVEDGALIVGRVVIGAGALVDSYAVMEDSTAVGADATLGQLSALRSGAAVPAGEWWEGAPARFVGYDSSAAAPQCTPGPLRRLWELAFYPLAGAVISALFFLPVFPAFMLIDAIDANWLDTFDSGTHTLVAGAVYLLLALPAATVLVALTLLIAALVRRIACPTLVPGSWPIHGRVYYGKWIAAQIQENSLHLLHGLFATVYAPWWFRLLGARIGRNSEISTATGVTPDLLSMGEDSFVADGAMLGDEPVRGGVFTLIGTRVGARSFIGNGACVPDGSAIPDDVLIGVQSFTPPNECLAPGQTWIGNPPIALPARETTAAFPDHLTFHPSTGRRLARATVELLRIVVPLAFIIAFGYLAVRLIMPYFEEEEWASGLLALAAAGFIYGAISVCAVLAAKWLLIGRYRPRAAPMWTLFVWLSEAVTSLYESLAVPNFLSFLRGTPLLPWVLRLFGTRIGRGAWLNTTDLTEFDCVDIGAGAEFNDDSGPQTHLFEDRVMKIGRVRVGNGAVIGVRSTILYDSEVGARVKLGPLTLVSKGERLPEGTAWEGSPSAPANPGEGR
jgi:non-ribosomal peptide synthetase-like protein